MMRFDYIKSNDKETSEKQSKIHQNIDFLCVVVRKSHQVLSRILITFAHAKFLTCQDHNFLTTIVENQYFDEFLIVFCDYFHHSVLYSQMLM